MNQIPVLPPKVVLEPLLKQWLLEDLGRGDWTSQCLLNSSSPLAMAQWLAKEEGLITGLPIAAQLFQLVNSTVEFVPTISEGQCCSNQQVIAQIHGPLDALLMGERVALNLTMRLSGIATLTRKYVKELTGLPVQLVDTRKTTPGLRILEKYASQVGGAKNHRMGLDDAVMIKDNHIAAVGSIGEAITRVRRHVPYPLTIEVETETLSQVEEAIYYQADIIMLDNMPLEMMEQAVQLIRASRPYTKIEASGNITLKNIRAIAETGVNYISTSAPITRSSWLDLSMKIISNAQK